VWNIIFTFSIRSGASGLPYYCAPLVCISVVIELLAVWRHNKPKTKKNFLLHACSATVRFVHHWAEGTRVAKVKGCLRGKIVFLNEDFFMKYFFGCQKLWHIANVEFRDFQVYHLFYWDTRTGRGSPKNRDQSSMSVFSKRAFWRVKWRYSGDFPALIWKKTESFSTDVIRTLLQGASSTSHTVSDFEVFNVFWHNVQCRLE